MKQEENWGAFLYDHLKEGVYKAEFTHWLYCKLCVVCMCVCCVCVVVVVVVACV